MSKLTDQELLEIIQQAKPIEPEPQDNLALFISTFGLEEGSLKVPVKLIYRLYNRWTKTKMTEAMFYKHMTLLLPNKEEIEGTTCYLLNQNTIKITENIFKLIKDKQRSKNTHHYKKHFESFLKSCNIEKGSDWVPVSELRSIYLNWIKIKYKKSPLGMQAFEGFCRLYMDVRGIPLEVAVNKKVMNAPTKKGQEEA